VDFSTFSATAQVEDCYVFIENGQFHMIMRDMGVFSDRSGLYLHSEDGIHWSEPMLGYKTSDHYFEKVTYRFERP
jgi:hypothetical protein